MQDFGIFLLLFVCAGHLRIMRLKLQYEDGSSRRVVEV
jgi:hypothetical protein